MPGQMCWLPALNSGGEKILHLRFSQGDRWQPYTAPTFSQFRQPDSVLKSPLPGGKELRLSKGMTTAQILLAQGWVYIKSNEAYSANPTAIAKVEPWSMQRAIAQAKQFGLVQ